MVMGMARTGGSSAVGYGEGVRQDTWRMSTVHNTMQQQCMMALTMYMIARGCIACTASKSVLALLL